MDLDQIVDRLQDLGLTEYQSRGYLAAVALGNATPGRLAEEADIPQPRIYDVIADLEELGFVEVQEHASGKEVVAPPPETVLELFKDRQVTEITATVDSVIEGLESLHEREERFENFVTMVGTRQSALRHASQAVESAEWWLTLAVPVSMYESLVPEIRDAVDRGVTVLLTLPDDDAIDDAPSFDGIDVRFRPLADTMVLADRRYGVFGSSSPRTDSESYIVTQDTNLVFLFQNFFHQFWVGSKTLRSDDAFPRRYLDPWRAIIDIRDEFEAGTDFYVTASGYNNREQRSGQWDGLLTDYDLSGPVEADYSVVIPSKAALYVDIDGNVTEIGGRKARLAGIAADGLEVDRLDD